MRQFHSGSVCPVPEPVPIPVPVPVPVPVSVPVPVPVPVPVAVPIPVPVPVPVPSPLTQLLSYYSTTYFIMYLTESLFCDKRKFKRQNMALMIRNG